MIQASKLYGLSACLGKAGLAASGAANTFTIATAFNYAIQGKAYNKGTVAGGASPVLDGVTGLGFVPLLANQGCVFAWAVDSTGAVKAIQGPVFALDSAGNFSTPPGAPQFPEVPDSLAMWAYTVVKNGATGSSWTFGTSNWNATGITLAHQDVICMPRVPQTA
jgi:hypothetical protein